MKQFQNVLIVVKDEEVSADNPAIMRGVALAQNSGAKLTLMDVVSPPGKAISHYKGVIEPEELTAMLVEKREQALQRIADQQPGELNITVKVAVGKDFIEIIRQMVFAEHDLLIKVANDHPGSFDSSDFHLMRKCAQPVWLLKPNDSGQSKKVLAAIDLSLEENDEGRALNASIMDLATSLAAWDNSELHVLSCWSLYGESSLRDGFIRVSEEKLDRLLEEEQRANRDQQAALIARYPRSNIHAHLIKGQPADHIPEFAKEHAVDVLVMGTVARSGIPGLLIGNTSESILHLIDNSVITLKPEGFESIVK